MKKNSPNYSYLAIIIFVIAILVFSISRITPVYAQAKNRHQDSVKVVSKHKVIIVNKNGSRKIYDSESDVPAEDKKRIKEELVNETRKNNKTIREVIITNEDGNNDDDVNLETITGSMPAGDKNFFSSFIDSDALASAMATVRSSISTIDLSSVMETVQQSLAEAKKSLSDPKIKKELKEELEKAQKELEKAKIELDKAKKEAHTSIRVMKKDRMGVTPQDIDDFDEMVNKMAADGLLDKDNYELEKKHGHLYIDGVKQSDEVYKKYEDYFTKNDISIKNTKKCIEK